jgi:hypothetical protein
MGETLAPTQDVQHESTPEELLAKIERVERKTAEEILGPEGLEELESLRAIGINDLSPEQIAKSNELMNLIAAEHAAVDKIEVDRIDRVQHAERMERRGVEILDISVLKAGEWRKLKEEITLVDENGDQVTFPQGATINVLGPYRDGDNVHIKIAPDKMSGDYSFETFHTSIPPENLEGIKISVYEALPGEAHYREPQSD